MTSSQQVGIAARLKRLAGFGGGRGSEARAAAIYGKAVARARSPELYEHFGVPDTPAGRYEMITWQVLIELTLLGQQGEEGRQQGQEVVDLMFRDMDRSLRELGVGDLSVGKEMRKLGETWQARIELAERVLPAVPGPTAATSRAELADFLVKNASGDGPPVDGAGLADHLLATLDRMRTQPSAPEASPRP
jgi:cytochrome b pre-mRNA-processing protein 3